MSHEQDSAGKSKAHYMALIKFSLQYYLQKTDNLSGWTSIVTFNIHFIDYLAAPCVHRAF